MYSAKCESGLQINHLLITTSRCEVCGSSPPPLNQVKSKAVATLKVNITQQKIANMCPHPLNQVKSKAVATLKVNITQQKIAKFNALVKEVKVCNPEEI